LTTGAVGASIILFDPLFQGLAISLVFGAIVSTILTLIVVPLIYYVTERKKWESSQTSEEGDVETTKKILNNFNYANFLPMGGQLGIIL
jgi:large-conductance mechanosensitive channel